MNLNALPSLDPAAAKSDHSFVFNAHNHDLRQLITRYRGTVVERTELGTVITGWQKSIYHFGGLNREVPILVTILLENDGQIRSIKIDEQSEGSQGKRCDFSCLETLSRKKLKGTSITTLNRIVPTADDVKCLHLFEILSACSSFYIWLSDLGLTTGTEQEYIAIHPDRTGLTADVTHEILDKRDHMQIRLDNNLPPVLNEENLAERIDASVSVRHNEEHSFSEHLSASDFETVYAQFNRLFAKCQHLEKKYFGMKGRIKFSNYPSMVGLFLLTLSHSGVGGGVARAWKIEKILHYLQTGYGRNPCKGFDG